MAQTVKNLPAMQGTQVQPLVWKDPWRKEWQPTTVFLPEETHRQRSLAGYVPWGCIGLGTTEQLTFFYIYNLYSLYILSC